MKLALTAILHLALQAAPLQNEYKNVDFGRPIDDWFIFDLDGDGWREILVFHPLEDEGRPYSLARREGEDWRLDRGTMERDVVALALGDFGLGSGRQLALIRTDRVGFLALDDDKKLTKTGAEIAFTNLIRTPLVGAPGFWHWPTDVDGDGHDDLFLPGDDGIVMLFADGSGGFAPPLLLEVAGTRRVTSDGTGHLDYLRSYPRPIFSDLDGDGRKDMVWFDSTGLFARLQKEARGFDADNPVEFVLPWLSGLDSDGIIEQTEVSLDDLNGDGRPDLFLSRMSTPASGITDLRTTLVVLINREKELFSRRPDFALRVQGVVGNGPNFIDIDGDGALDLVFGSYGAGMSDALQRMMGTVKITFHIHRGIKGAPSPFDNRPTRLLELEMDKDDFGLWGARKNFQVGEDMNGDGIGDLFAMKRTGRNSHRLQVFTGRSAGDDGIYFAKEPGAEFDGEDLKTMSFRTMAPDLGIAMVLVRESSIGVLQLR